MISDLKHSGNPPKPIPWFSVIVLFVVLSVVVWMQHRDREHMRDNQALVETVTALQEVIDNTQCGAGFEMSMPVNVGS